MTHIGMLKFQKAGVLNASFHILEVVLIDNSSSNCVSFFINMFQYQDSVTWLSHARIAQDGGIDHAVQVPHFIILKSWRHRDDWLLKFEQLSVQLQQKNSTRLILA